MITPKRASRLTGIPAGDLRTLTIWPHWSNPLIPTIIAPQRRVLHYSWWSSQAIATVLSTGMRLENPTVIRVFSKTSGLTFIAPHLWAELPENELSGYWTANPAQQGGGTMIALFESDHEISPGALNQVSQAENMYMQGQSPNIPGTPGVSRIVALDNNERLWGPHIRMQARA